MNKKKLKVLFIDDNRDDIEMVREMLLKDGTSDFQLESEYNLSSGLKRLSEDNFDVLILDLGLPDSKGVDTLKKIQSHFPEVPVVVLTGLNDKAVWLNAAQWGMQDYLIKGQMNGDLLKRSLSFAIERKNILMRLEVEKNKARQYLELINIIMVIITTDEKVELINKKGCKILGYAEEDIVGKNWFDNFLPQSERERVRATFNMLISGEIEPVEYFENSILTKEGKEKVIEWHNSAIRDANGKIRATLGSGQDVTERNKVSKELAILTKQIEFILGATKTGIDIIDSNFNMVYVDPEWQKIYGDYKGRKCYEYFTGRNEMCPGCGIPKALETKTAIITEEVLPKECNRPIQVTTTPFQNEKGEWLVAEVNVDITERRKAEEDIKRSLNDLQNFKNVTIGRENKMIELKKEINRLSLELGKSEPYNLSFLSDKK